MYMKKFGLVSIYYKTNDMYSYLLTVFNFDNWDALTTENTKWVFFSFNLGVMASVSSFFYLVDIHHKLTEHEINEDQMKLDSCFVVLLIILNVYLRIL